jgi:hypothetical protein
MTQLLEPMSPKQITAILSEHEKLEQEYQQMCDEKTQIDDERKMFLEGVAAKSGFPAAACLDETTSPDLAKFKKRRDAVVARMKVNREACGVLPPAAQAFKQNLKTLKDSGLTGTAAAELLEQRETQTRRYAALLRQEAQGNGTKQSRAELQGLKSELSISDAEYLGDQRAHEKVVACEKRLVPQAEIDAKLKEAAKITAFVTAERAKLDEQSLKATQLDKDAEAATKLNTKTMPEEIALQRRHNERAFGIFRMKTR